MNMSADVASSAPDGIRCFRLINWRGRDSVCLESVCRPVGSEYKRSQALLVRDHWFRGEQYNLIAGRPNSCPNRRSISGGMSRASRGEGFFVWGCGHLSQEARPVTHLRPKLIESLQTRTICNLASGWTRTLVTSYQGELFCWGLVLPTTGDDEKDRALSSLKFRRVMLPGTASTMLRTRQGHVIDLILWMFVLWCCRSTTHQICRFQPAGSVCGVRYA